MKRFAFALVLFCMPMISHAAFLSLTFAQGGVPVFSITADNVSEPNRITLDEVTSFTSLAPISGTTNVGGPGTPITVPASSLNLFIYRLDLDVVTQLRFNYTQGVPAPRLLFVNAGEFSAVVPEPATLALLGMGLIGVALRRRRPA